MKMVSFSALHTGRLYPPENILSNRKDYVDEKFQ